MASGLIYLDFMPQLLEDGLFSEAVYERFDVLMSRANEWLRSHPNYRVLTCESVEMKQKQGSYVVPEKMSFYERGKVDNRFVRALRIWARPAFPNEPMEPQQIAHLNVVPDKVDTDGLFSRAKFGSLPETLQRVNTMFRSRPLPGFIINIETQDMKYHSSMGMCDPDECSWKESGKTGVYYVMVLRIFYCVGPPVMEEIGCADIAPRRISGSQMEGFGSVVALTRSWLSKTHGVRFINVQSIDYKLKRDWGGEELDTHRMSYYEQGKTYTRYVRIIRICYGKPMDDSNLPQPLPPMPTLNYKTFEPVMLRDAALGSPEYETMSQTWQRAMAWLQAANVTNFLSVETVPVRLHSGKQYGNSEVTYTRNHGDRNEYWIFVIRIYINGPYQEPPAEALPPEPETEEECCSIL